MSDQALPPTGGTRDSLGPGLRDQPSWLDTPGHRTGLRTRFADVLTFALPSDPPLGGFAYQAADGSPMPGRRPQLFLDRADGVHSRPGCAARHPGLGGACSTTRWRHSSASTPTASTAGGSASRGAR